MPSRSVSPMNQPTPAYFVCSPRSRVGKTTLARLIADYHAVESRPFIVYDTDPEHTAAGHYPERSVIADLTRIEGQMKLFDGLLEHNQKVRIVDLWHRSWDTFIETVEQIDIFSETEKQNIRPVFVFVADASAKSLEAASALVRRFPKVTLVVVHNEGAASLGTRALDELSRYPTNRTFEIPALHPAMRVFLEDPTFSFARFLMAPPTTMSIVVRAGLRQWTARIFAQFQSFELRLAMDEARYLR